MYDLQVCTINNVSVGLSALYQLVKMLITLELHGIVWLNVAKRTKSFHKRKAQKRHKTYYRFA